jgi:hypothetical protein
LSRGSRSGFLFEELALLAAAQPQAHVLEVEKMHLWMPLPDAAAAAAAAAKNEVESNPDDSQQQLPNHETPSPHSQRRQYSLLYRRVSPSSTIANFPVICSHVTSLIKQLRNGVIGWHACSCSVWQLGRLLERDVMPPLFVCTDLYVRPWGDAVVVALRGQPGHACQPGCRGVHDQPPSSSSHSPPYAVSSPSTHAFDLSLSLFQRMSQGLFWVAVCGMLIITINHCIHAITTDWKTVFSDREAFFDHGRRRAVPEELTNLLWEAIQQPSMETGFDPLKQQLEEQLRLEERVLLSSGMLQLILVLVLEEQ